MKRIASLLCAVGLVGCLADPDDYRPRPGEGGGGSGSGDDVSVSGELCLVTDLRSPTSCRRASLRGVQVLERGSKVAVLAGATGEFELATAGETKTVLETGRGTNGLRPTIVTVPLSEAGAAGVLVPVLLSANWSRLRAALGVAAPDGSAAIAVYVRRGGRAVPGATVLQDGGSLFPPFYDGPGAENWQQVQTGSRGAALLFGVPADFATHSLSVLAPDGQTEVRVNRIPIASGTTTFVTVELPAVIGG